MIEIKVKHRGSGKSLEIYRKFRKDPENSIIVCRNYNIARLIKKLIKHNNIYSHYDMPKDVYFEHYYFDEFFDMNFDVSYIKYLDQIGKNIYLYGNIKYKLEGELKDYMIEFYPEEFI